MSGSTKRKHVANEILDDYVTVSDDQFIVKVLQAKGNSLYEIETPDNNKYLVSMPSKFRKTVWVKPGSFVVIEEIKEGNKVKGEITNVLMKHHIKLLKKNGDWPEQFETDKKVDIYDDDNFNCED